MDMAIISSWCHAGKPGNFGEPGCRACPALAQTKFERLHQELIKKIEVKEEQR